MRISQLALASILIIGVSACERRPAADTTATAESDANADEAIRGNVDAFVAAWNRADTATFAGMVADDAVVLPPEGPPVEGKNAIVNATIGNYDIAAFQQSAVVDEVRAFGDKAYARGTWQLAPTAAGQSVAGKWSVIYQRSAGGEWQIWRWMWNQPPAAEVAPAG